jgi:ATP-dependent DNA helicase RecQ
MTKKVARNGRNAGEEFWGCSAFPKCREIVNITGNTSPENPIASTPPQVDIPPCATQFYASPLSGLNDMQSFQSIALRASSLSLIRNQLVNEENIRSKSRFRVDFSQPKHRLKCEQETICSLILRMLCRGTITINSPKIESVIESLFPSYDTYTDKDYRACSLGYSTDLPLPVDSEREKAFIERYLKLLFGELWTDFVSTQVYIRSLVPQDSIAGSFLESSQRVDFLISINGKDIIIELDGPEHELHKEKDDERDAILIRNGYEVIRFKNQDIDDQPTNILEELAQILRKADIQLNSKKASHNAIQAAKIVHQIQISIVSAMQKGVIPSNAHLKLVTHTDFFTLSETAILFQAVIDDLHDLYKNFCFLYGIDDFFDCKYSNNGDVSICLGCTDPSASSAVIITNIGFSRDILNAISSVDTLEIRNHNEALLTYFLGYVFRFKETKFKEGQLEGIGRLLSRKDSIILLPTGSGKSLIFQLSSLLVPGKIVVICPLTSLMQDQLDNLRYVGIDCVTAIYHGNTAGSSESAVFDPRITLAYISPERLQVKAFRDSINNLLIKNSVFAVAVDEAHCVSEWGHDFRTAYLNIGRTSREVFQKNRLSPVILALTGTASTAVLKDVKRELEINDYDAIITPKSFDRSELHYRVFKSSSEGKPKLLEKVVNDYIPDQFRQTQASFFNQKDDLANGGIVFCHHVNGNFGVQKVCSKLTTYATIDYYSGSAPKVYVGNWDTEKRRVATAFKSNKVNLLVATKAFGMGIDKPNIRFTIHYGIPGSIESFYQEAGRAGRDGNNAWCAILLSDDNHAVNQRLLDPSTPLEEVVEKASAQNIEENDDISRVLYFHMKAFKGIPYEIERVVEIAKSLFSKGTLAEETTIIKCGSDKDKNSLNDVQKALQRLLVLGVVSDYTVDYSSKEIYVKPGRDDDSSIHLCYRKYVHGYNEGRVAAELSKLKAATSLINDSRITYVVAATKVLIEFIYDTIEKGRRRALREMVKVAEAALASSNQDNEVRTRIVRYFESTYSEEIDSVIESKDWGFDRIPIILDGTANEVGESVGGIRSANEAMGLRGQVSRYLESTPDHPGLLALRALSELYSKEYDIESVEIDFAAFIDFALNRYSCPKQRIIDFLIYFFRKSCDRDSSVYCRLFDKVVPYVNIQNICSAILDSTDLSEDKKAYPASIFFNEKAKQLLENIQNIKGE